MEVREGPPLIYVPICKHPRDFMFTFGPVGYKRVDTVAESPILVRATEPEPPDREHD